VPTVPDVPERLARYVVGVICFLVCMLLTYAAAGFVGLWPVIFILLISAWVSASCIYWIDGSLPAAVIQRFLMLFRPRLPKTHERARGRLSVAGDIVAGSLVCLFADYQQRLADHGPSAIPPEVPYRLVLAAYEDEGERRLAFSDGKSAVWHATNTVLVNRLDESWWRPERDDETGAAAALCDLIAFLSETRERSVRAVRERLSGHPESDVDRALDAARWWRLISVGGRSACLITIAGLDWHHASEEFEAARLAQKE
jgi:hypothetical protein